MRFNKLNEVVHTVWKQWRFFIHLKHQQKKQEVYNCFIYWAVDFYKRKIKRLKEAKKALRRKKHDKNYGNKKQNQV